MYGRVNGPFTNKINNNKYIGITLYNKDGSIKNKTIITYSRYLKEVEQGLHQYEDYIPLTRYEKRLKYFNKVREEYNLPLITEANKEQFYYPNAYEIEKTPGYYYIPFIGSVYAINKQGLVINISNRSIIEYHSLREYQFSNITLINNSDKTIKRISISKHRMLALLFIPRPDRHLDKSYNKLEVNHKDGIKINNDLNNLEWVTGIENNDHAVINGLNINVCESRPVLAKNIITGEVKYYYSTGVCAKEFNIDSGQLRKHLNSVNYGLASMDNYIFKYDDDTPWPNRPPIAKNNKGYFSTIPSVITKNTVTGEITIYRSMKEAAKQLSFDPSFVYKYFKKHGKDSPYKNYLFYTVEEFKK